MFVLAGLVILGVGLAVLVGLGRLALGRRTARNEVLGGAGVPVAVLVGAVVVVVVGLVAVTTLGLPGGPPDTASTDEPPPTTTTPPEAPVTNDRDAPPTARSAPPPVRRAPPVARSAALGPVVRMKAEEPRADSFPGPLDAVAGLGPDTVLRVHVRGFEPFTEARARQCVTTGRVVCGNAIEVQVGSEGTASFQYLVDDDFAPDAGQGRCRARAAPCSVVVEELDGERRAAVHTVFHDPLGPPARIHVSPRSDLADGQRLTVAVQNYPPGARVQAMVCAAPDSAGTERCGAPGPTAPMTVRADGTARATLTIRAGAVGRVRAFCGRGRTCGISVASENVTTNAPVVPITFATGPGAGYHPPRLAAGLGAATILVALAVWLVRRTDWSPVGEEAAPEIDEAEYADLDAIVAALPPEEDLDDLLSRRP